MQASRIAWWVLTLLVLGSPSGVLALSWSADVYQARRLAAQSGKLVLLHFWAPWCGPCRRLEKQVLSRPEVGRWVEEHFVPVKINLDRSPGLVRQYDVRFVPCDVIITPTGQLVGKTASPQEPRAYMARLAQIAARAPKPSASVAASAGSTPPRPAVPNRPSSAGSPPGSPTATSGPSPGQAAQAAPMTPPYSRQAEPVGSATLSASPPRFPWPLALDGYCVVTLVEQHRWQPGDPRYGVRHRGQLYLFAGPAEKQRFWQNPEAYAPVLSGLDVVIYLEQGRMVPGKRRYGIFYQGRIYLFASPQSLQKFTAQPEAYAPEVLRRMAVLDQWARRIR